MSDALPDHLENSFLDAICNQANYTAATAIYAALFTPVTPITDTVIGAEVAAAGGGGDGGYDRVNITTFFSAASSGSCPSTSNIDFVHDGNAEPGWTVGAVAIMDHATTLNIANLLMYFNFSAQIDVPTGDTLRFVSGLFICTIS